jgi:hypothetical protein
MREGAHIARALHVVLAAQRVHAYALAPEVASDHGQIGDADDHRRALTVLGYAQPVVDRAVARAGIKTCGASQVLRLAARAHEVLLVQALGDDHVRQRVDHRYVRPRQELQVVVGFHVRHAHEIDRARVHHDELRALAQPALHLRGEDRMAIGRIGADDDDDVGLLDRVEILGASRLTQSRFQAVTGR